jgi:hypothetical protein
MGSTFPTKIFKIKQHHVVTFVVVVVPTTDSILFLSLNLVPANSTCACIQ